jgi:hypothetical protein
MTFPDVILTAGIVLAALIVNAWSIYRMSQSLDNLTAQVGALETAAANAVSEISKIKTETDDAALDALALRVGAVATSLTNAITPPSA